MIFTPASHLFVPVGADEIKVDCSTPVQAFSLYCLADSTDRQFLNLLVLALLLIVASGILPRYTTVVHFWASLSVGQSISLPDGATYYVARMENFGAGGFFAEVFRWATSVTLIALLSAWGTIFGESLIAFLLLRGGSRQAIAAAISTCLHILIILQPGIVSFGFVMVGAVICAASRGIDAHAPRVKDRLARARGSVPGDPPSAPADPERAESLSEVARQALGPELRPKPAPYGRTTAHGTFGPPR